MLFETILKTWHLSVAFHAALLTGQGGRISLSPQTRGQLLLVVMWHLLWLHKEVPTNSLNRVDFSHSYVLSSHSPHFGCRSQNRTDTSWYFSFREKQETKPSIAKMISTKKVALAPLCRYINSKVSAGFPSPLGRCQTVRSVGLTRVFLKLICFGCDLSGLLPVLLLDFSGYIHNYRACLFVTIEFLYRIPCDFNEVWLISKTCVHMCLVPPMSLSYFDCHCLDVTVLSISIVQIFCEFY